MHQKIFKWCYVSHVTGPSCRVTTVKNVGGRRASSNSRAFDKISPSGYFVACSLIPSHMVELRSVSFQYQVMTHHSVVDVDFHVHGIKVRPSIHTSQLGQ